MWAEYMMSRSRLPAVDNATNYTGHEHKTAWQLDGDDIKIDHFIKNFYKHLVPHDDRSKYASVI